ncbi:MAG: DUF177 domain-containing protein [Bacteroidia bacterium]|nr:DUF177 domain-containing protein [Bacteroidia bacterium]
MKYLDRYSIPFKGLKEGAHEFLFDVSDRFFLEFEQSEVTSGQFMVKVKLDKSSQMMVLDFDISGSVWITCDRCLELFSLPLKFNGELFVKFGSETLERTDDLLVLSYAEHELNISQFIYESIDLSMPMKRVHPEDENGFPGCDKDMLEKINEFTNRTSVPGVEDFDPRWKELQKLLNNN